MALRWRAATPGLAAAAAGGEEGAVDLGIEVSGLFLRAVDDALYRSGGNGAGSRKWRGVAEVARAAASHFFAPTHMGCFLLYHLYALSDFFLSKLIDSLERWHPREAFILAKRHILAKLFSSSRSR